MLSSKFFKLVSASFLAIASCNFASIAQAGSANAIQLTYFDSQIQCGAAGELIDVEVEVYDNGQLIKTLSKNETIYLPMTSFDDLSFNYNFANSTCLPIATPEEMVFGPNDTVPNLAGAYAQDSLQVMLDGLDEYEELFTVELGTNDPIDPVFDRQDVVLVIDHQPPFVD